MDLTQIARNLTQRGYQVTVAPDETAAVSKAISLIGSGKAIGMGGCETAKSLKLPEALMKAGCTMYANAYQPELPVGKIREKAHQADWYLCSANALTEGGVLINIDGVCNRIASMLYGSKNVLFLIGKNKIAKDIPSGVRRIKEVACPKNARRLRLSTPCATKGVCQNCDSPDRMCRGTLILEYPPRGRSISIILIDKELGY